MLSKRLQAICDLVDKNKSVIDIGTDHAYIPIYLYENGITNNICASDISRKVIEYAKKNIIAHHLEDKIKVVVSDGFKNICDLIVYFANGSITCQSTALCACKRFSASSKLMFTSRLSITESVISSPRCAGKQ